LFAACNQAQLQKHATHKRCLQCQRLQMCISVAYSNHGITSVAEAATRSLLLTFTRVDGWQTCAYLQPYNHMLTKACFAEGENGCC
jgi:hypothetical protein